MEVRPQDWGAVERVRIQGGVGREDSWRDTGVRGRLVYPTATGGGTRKVDSQEGVGTGTSRVGEKFRIGFTE